MRYSTLGLCMIGGCLLATSAWADSKLNWTRNVETDMSHYRVYACKVKGCVVSQSGPMLQPGAITQPPVGSSPQWDLPVDTEGAAAVSAVDQSSNESGISVSVPFDRKAPAIPVNPVTQ